MQKGLVKRIGLVKRLTNDKKAHHQTLFDVNRLVALGFSLSVRKSYEACYMLFTGTAFLKRPRFIGLIIE